MEITTLKNTSRKPYIYKVTNLETGRYYIGSQCRGKIIGVNYFTSSHNKEFKEDFKNYGEEKYKIEIIKEFEDPDECVNDENLMIRDHMLLKDGLCLNRFYCCNGEKVFSRVGTHGWNKGLPWSEEVRQKMRKPKKGRPSPRRIKISIEGEVFNSLTEASKYYNVGKTSIRRWVKKNQRPSPRRIKISIEGEIFNSLTEASQYYKVCKSTIRYWIKTKKHNTVYIEK